MQCILIFWDRVADLYMVYAYFKIYFCMLNFASIGRVDLVNKLCKHFNQFSNSYQLQTLTSFSTRNIFQGSIFFCNSFIKTFPLLVTKFLQPPILLAATLNGKWTDNLIPNFSNQLPRMHPCWFYVDIYLRT